jgi:hypothetical protein
MVRNKYFWILLSVTSATVIFVFSKSRFGFFWDNVMQLSVPANWYFDNNFSSLLVPDEIATGHPPAVSLYLALWWKMLGRTLFVSHLAFAPFIFGIILQLIKFIRLTGSFSRDSFLILLLLLVDPTLLSQMSLLTFELPMLFFFLLCINSIIDSRFGLLAISFALLCITSLRGTMCGLGVILFALTYNKLIIKRISLNYLIAFLPGLFLFSLFILWFYIEKGWIIHNTVSLRWPGSSEAATISGIFRNAGIFAWRLVDFGRIGIWLFLLIVFIKNGLKGLIQDKNRIILLSIIATQAAVFVPILITSGNPVAHRYLLPIIIPVTIFAGSIINDSFRRRALYIIVLGVLVSGNFWVYPERIAQGWDATPAHWPYYKLRSEMQQYIILENIPSEEVGSFFPFNFSVFDTDLTGARVATKPAEIDRDKFIVYSNVFNVDDEIIDELFRSGNWIARKKIRYGSVYISLYQRIEP